MIQEIYSSTIKLDSGRQKEIEVLHKKGILSEYFFSSKNTDIKAGFTLGGYLDFYHPTNNGKQNAIETLKVLNIKNAEDALKIYPEHKDKIAVDKEQSDCDGIISTKGNPVILAPADCLGIIVIDLNSGIFGVYHAGRAGIGLNITQKFFEKFLNLVDKNSADIKAIISPHIFAKDYPHPTQDFLKTEGKDNWWAEHPEFIFIQNGLSYPSLGMAVVEQIESVSNEFDLKIEIINSNLNTFDGAGFSHSRDRIEGRDYLKRRNLVFVGVNG